MARYEFYLTDDAGRRITLLNNIAFMSISRTLKGYGTFHMGIPWKDFKVRPAFLPDRRVEIWRSPSHGATLRREGSFFLRKYNVYVRETDSVEIIEFFGRSPIDILRRQHVTSITAADYSKTDFIDDMMKEIVDENFVTPPQTVPTGELTVDGGESLGPSISHTFFAQNVLDVLKELRDISWTLNETDPSNRRIYFDVVEGSPLTNGGYGYSFRTYADLRGTDRTGGIIFSVENGNMESPSYYEDHLDSITHAKVLNLGTPAADGEATSPEASLSRWNDIVSAQQSSELFNTLNDSKANQMIQDGKADNALNATFLDSPGSNRQPRSLYGVDWDLGDLLPVRYADKDFNAEVTIVYLSINEDGKENIVGMSNLRTIAAEVTEEVSPYLDFSEFTEVDSGGKLTVTSYTITAANLLRNEDSYVYKDYGAAYFNALDIDFEIYIDVLTSASGGIGEMGLTVATINDGTAWGTSDVGVYGLGAASPIIRLVRGATVAFDSSIALAFNTLYYCTLTRTAGSDTITCTIYSNAARTTVVDTLSVAGYGIGTTYRYLYGMASYNSGDAFRFDGYVQNINLNL